MSAFTHKVTHQLGRRLRRVLSCNGLTPVRRYFTGLGSCLLYHRVGEHNADRGGDFLPNAGLTVSPRSFEAQMRFISKNYRCLSLEEAVFDLNRGKLKPDSVMVSFDDGYRDNLVEALPILERFNVPATVFVATSLVDGQGLLWWYEIEFILEKLDNIDLVWQKRIIRRQLKTSADKTKVAHELFSLMRSLDHQKQHGLMQKLRSLTDEKYDFRKEILTWDEVRELDRHPLVTIGAHTVNHPVLRNESLDNLKFELTESKKILESRLGHDVKLFSYPFGLSDDADAREFAITGATGYSAAVTTRFGHLQRDHAERLHSIPRINIDHRDDLGHFHQKLKGIDAIMLNKGRRTI